MAIVEKRHHSNANGTKARCSNNHLPTAAHQLRPIINLIKIRVLSMVKNWAINLIRDISQNWMVARRRGLVGKMYVYKYCCDSNSNGSKSIPHSIPSIYNVILLIKLILNRNGKRNEGTQIDFCTFSFGRVFFCPFVHLFVMNVVVDCCCCLSEWPGDRFIHFLWLLAHGHRKLDARDWPIYKNNIVLWYDVLFCSAGFWKWSRSFQAIRPGRDSAIHY